MRTFRQVTFTLLLLLPVTDTHALTYSDYETAFISFTQSGNHWMPLDASKDLARYNWDISEGWTGLAIRLAGMENVESDHFRVAAWLDPSLPPAKLWPRYDAMGSHINLSYQEGRKLGFFNDPFYTYSDEMDAFLEKCAHDPAWGTWVVSHAYVRQAKKVGLDGASHWWQTGKTLFSSQKEYEDDGYLKNVHNSEAFFITLIPGAPRKVAPIKRWRKKK